MKRESLHKSLKTANYLRRWINLKKVFEMGPAVEAWDDPNRIMKEKPHVKGMPDMLK